jgi:hypothetical protein
MKNKSLTQMVSQRYLESAKRDDSNLKNTGKGGLGTWFAGHGGGDPDDRATWGDWIAITPVKHTITKEDGEKKTYEPGDIVGPCAISSEKEWADVTSGGKKPLKCMPREKAWKMPKQERADLAKKKRREEAKHRGKKPVNTPTFSEEAKEITKKKKKTSGLIRPPQHLLDKVAEIGKGLLAQYWIKREKEDSSKGGLDLESVEGLEWILEELDYLPLGVKRGEHDEEEVIFQVNNVQRAFSEIGEQMESANLKYSDFHKIKAKIDQLDAQSIFNDPRGNKAHIGSISDRASDLLREFKKWSTGSKQYIPTLMRDDYLEAVERLSKYKVKDSGRYYVEDDELGLVAVHLQESSHGAAQYYWDGIHHIIFNVLKNMTELPLKYLTDRETIAGHELVHAMQQHYANKANIEEAGLPSQKRDEQFRFDMKEKQKELRVQYAREGMDFELISIHALDDIEFYSRLLDEVTEFKRRNKGLNDEIHKWVKKRPFFVSLKRFKRKNWKKAVGIFVGAVKPNAKSKSYKKKTSGLIRPPQHLVDQVSDLAQGILARYVMREPPTLIDIEEADFLENFLDYLNDPRSFDDAGELHDDVDDFRMEYWELKNIIVKDFEIPKSMIDSAEKLEECLKFVTAWSEVDKSFEWRRNSILHKDKRSVVENEIKQYLRSLIDYIRMAQNRTPHQDDREFKLALSKLDESSLTKENSFYHVEAMIEDDNLSLPIHLVILFEEKRKILGSHQLFKGKKHLIKIYVPSQRGLSKKDLIETHNTVRHELVHLVQDEIALKNNLPTLSTGIPFSKRDKKYTQWNRRDEQRLKREYRSKGLDPNLVNFHALDDVEFYTLLLDEVEEFKSDYTSPTNADIKKHIRKKTFFKSLREFKKESWGKAVGLFVKSVKTAASQPAQDLGGVKTWVDKTRQDQINNDTNPEESRSDFADGKPQRDRVLPLPSGHPEGRDEQRMGPGVINSPPDSSGQGGANRPKKDPSALNDHPNGKALHERPRSSGIPGDEYGHPYLDQSQSTGLSRRVMASIEKISYVDEDDFYAEEDDFYWDIEDDMMVKNALFRYNYRPPRGNKRQRSQKGQAKRKSLKNKRQNRVKYRRNLIKQKRLYKRKKHNPTYKKYKKNYAKSPEKYKRRPGGVSTVKQKNQRAEKRRK